jgi:hypothetical protein
MARALFSITLLLTVGCEQAPRLPAPPADRPEPAEPQLPDPTPPSQPPTSPPDPRAGPSAEDARAPFAPLPDEGEGLTNTSADLAALLENGALEGACDAYREAPDDRRKELLCGKSMFFYEGFDTIGVPASLYDFFGNNFPTITGDAWDGYGLIPDPFTEGRPLGAAPGAPLGSVETVAFTCAHCHFGRLPDGRYSVGAPNHDYDYGAHILAITLPAQSVAPGFDAADHHPDAVARVQPILDALSDDLGLRLSLLLDLLPLLGAERPEIDPVAEGAYASWSTGTMDFMMAPLPMDDEADTVSKTLSLWSVPRPDEVEAMMLEHEMLSWTGGTATLMDFLRAFVVYGDGDAETWTRERLAPLEAYIRSLRPPANPAPPPVEASERGALVFARDCLRCHDGPRGMGRELYAYEEIGTDDAMRRWGNPDENGGGLCCGLDDGSGAVHATDQLKSPRLVGLWAQTRFLHNGAVGSLEKLLCLAPRSASRPSPNANVGHEYGCELDVNERRDLLAFLLSL